MGGGAGGGGGTAGTLVFQHGPVGQVLGLVLGVG